MVEVVVGGVLGAMSMPAAKLGSFFLEEPIFFFPSSRRFFFSSFCKEVKKKLMLLLGCFLTKEKSFLISWKFEKLGKIVFIYTYTVHIEGLLCCFKLKAVCGEFKCEFEKK